MGWQKEKYGNFRRTRPMDEEMDALLKKETWELKKAIGSKCLYKIKYKPN